MVFENRLGRFWDVFKYVLLTFLCQEKVQKHLAEFSEHYTYFYCFIRKNFAKIFYSN